MSQAVVIKSNKYGINLVLDKTMPFRELLVAIKEKFLESEKFFKDAKMAISFEGRELTQEEEYQIIETITENTSISIICIVDNDESHADLVKQQIEAYYDSVSGREGEFYRGTLRSGQVLESVSSVVIVGDVNPGAKIISQGNIVVLGALKGNAYAGAAGDSNCFIVALEMDPIQIQIGDILAKSPDHKKMKPMRRLRRKEKNSGDTGSTDRSGKGRQYLHRAGHTCKFERLYQDERMMPASWQGVEKMRSILEQVKVMEDWMQ